MWWGEQRQRDVSARLGESGLWIARQQCDPSLMVQDQRYSWLTQPSDNASCRHERQALCPGAEARFAADWYGRCVAL